MFCLLNYLVPLYTYCNNKEWKVNVWTFIHILSMSEDYWTNGCITSTYILHTIRKDVKIPLTQPTIHLLTQPPTQPLSPITLTQTPRCTPIHLSLNHSPTHSLIHPPTCSLLITYSNTNTHSATHSPIYLLTHCVSYQKYIIVHMTCSPFSEKRWQKALRLASSQRERGANVGQRSQDF